MTTEPQATQTHVTREGCSNLHTIGDALVSRYRRPLKYEKYITEICEISRSPRLAHKAPVMQAIA